MPERVPVGINAVVILSHLLSSYCRLSCTARLVEMWCDTEQKRVGNPAAALCWIHSLVRLAHSSRASRSASPTETICLSDAVLSCAYRSWSRRQPFSLFLLQEKPERGRDRREPDDDRRRTRHLDGCS